VYRIRSIILTTLAVGMAGSVMVPPAQATPSDTLTVFVTRKECQQIDLPPAGKTVGDVTIGVMDVSRKRGGPVVGTWAYNAITVRIDVPGGVDSRMATQWLTLPGGSIQTSALIEAPIGAPLVKEQSYVVSGGTGRFAGVRGTMSLTPVDDDERKLVFRFVK